MEDNISSSNDSINCYSKYGKLKKTFTSIRDVLLFFKNEKSVKKAYFCELHNGYHVTTSGGKWCRQKTIDNLKLRYEEELEELFRDYKR